MKLYLYLLTTPVKMTRFMQNADVFESFKVLVTEPVLFAVTYDPDKTTREALFARYTKLFTSDKLEDETGEKLVAIWAPFDETLIWHDPAVKSVSSGAFWTPVENYMRTYNAIA